jgi:hypothetical protein
METRQTPPPHILTWEDLSEDAKEKRMETKKRLLPLLEQVMDQDCRKLYTRRGPLDPRVFGPRFVREFYEQYRLSLYDIHLKVCEYHYTNETECHDEIAGLFEFVLGFFPPTDDCAQYTRVLFMSYGQFLANRETVAETAEKRPTSSSSGSGKKLKASLIRLDDKVERCFAQLKEIQQQIQQEEEDREKEMARKREKLMEQREKQKRKRLEIQRQNREAKRILQASQGASGAMTSNGQGSTKTQRKQKSTRSPATRVNELSPQSSSNGGGSGRSVSDDFSPAAAAAAAAFVPLVPPAASPPVSDVILKKLERDISNLTPVYTNQLCELLTRFGYMDNGDGELELDLQKMPKHIVRSMQSICRRAELDAQKQK